MKTLPVPPTITVVEGEEPLLLYSRIVLIEGKDPILIDGQIKNAIGCANSVAAALLFASATSMAKCIYDYLQFCNEISSLSPKDRCARHRSHLEQMITVLETASGQSDYKETKQFYLNNNHQTKPPKDVH